MRTLRSLAVAACLFGSASVGTCQDVPKAELTAGYSFLYDNSFSDSDTGGDFPLGWQTSAHFPITGLVGAVVDLSGHYKSREGGSDLSVYGFHGGIRLSTRDSARLTPYAQLLAGVTHGGAQVVCAAGAGPGCGVIGARETDFSIQPGIGFLVKVSNAVGIDVGGDYRLVFSEEKANEFRLHVGVAFLIGKK